MKRALVFMNKGGVSFDADAQAFIDAAVLTDDTQKNAINTLVLDLKANSLWAKMRAIYPFVGGTAFTHKWNLKDPRDLDAAFRITWIDPFSGTYIVHSSTGVRGTDNNAGQSGNTHFKDSDFTSYNSIHISKYTKYYSDSWEWGNINTGPISRSATFSTQSYYQLHGNLNLITCANTGFFIANRTSSTQSKLFVNNVKVADLTDNITGGTNTLDYALLSQWSNGSGNNSTAEWRFCSFGDSLSDAEASTFYTIIQAYQTTLSRPL